MTANRTCETCQFWANEHTEDEDDVPIGTCRRSAPTRIAADIGTAIKPAAGRCFPITWIHDWCGEWEEGPR